MIATDSQSKIPKQPPDGAAPDPLVLSVEEARTKVFTHLKSIDSLARRRFPRDENLALEASQFVLDHLEVDDWRRVRSWKGAGDFLPFLATLTSRLLTDFFRTKAGYIRKPRWLEEKDDPLWHRAYQLAVVEHGTRQDVVETLLHFPPPRGRWFIEEVVRTVLGRCSEHPRIAEAAADYEVEEIPGGSTPDQHLEIHAKELMEVVVALLEGGAEAISPRVAELAARLSPHLSLSDEDCLFLKLYYLEDRSMEAIKRLLQLEGDLYKRLKKLLAGIGRACEKAGLSV